MTESKALADVTLRVDDRIAILTLNRPEQMNAITLKMAEALVAIAAEVELRVRSDEVRVVVVTGSGERAFCTGADLKQRAAMSEQELWRHADLIRRFALACYEGSVPVIAAIRGYCLGGGLEIAVACDIRIAAEDATLGFTEAAIGAFPGAGGAVFTPRLVGTAVAKDLLYSASRVSGKEAAALGLVTHAVAPGGLEDRVHEHATRIASNGPLAIRALKRLLNHGAQLATDDAFALSDALRRPLNATSDYAEGLAAFGERRAPVFRAS